LSTIKIFTSASFVTIPILIEFRPPRYQSKRAWKAQLDDGIGDTLVSVFSFRVDGATGVDRKV
jgi:hypothetical protein